jgi:hypothetical protein
MGVIYKCKYCGKEIISDMNTGNKSMLFSEFMNIWLPKKVQELSDKCECRKSMHNMQPETHKKTV